MNRGPATYWGVVPAAGSGSRMGLDTPKQYLELAGETVLQRAVDALLDFEAVVAVVVALAPGDGWWANLPAARQGRVMTVAGGAQRCDSVLAGLRGLAGRARDDDWVLVHDAARPCLAQGDLARLVAALGDDAVGGLLALPVVDTVKRADARDRVLETVPRGDLWLAQTPQMFRYRLLCEALENALGAGVVITDEASAVEYAGYRPRLVPGSARNVKVTRPGDLHIAESYLQHSGD